MRTIKVLLLLSATFFYSLAISSPSTKNSLDVVLDDMQIVGQAKFSFLFWDIYDSALYTNSGQFEGTNKGLVLEINYLRNIKSKDLVEKTIDQWEHIGVSKRVYSKYVKEIESIWPDIIEGDQLALFKNSDSSTFYLNGQLLGTIQGSEFGELFSNIWLSKKNESTKPKNGTNFRKLKWI
jgi:hypothetical protein